MPVDAPVQFIGPREPKPEWLKVRAPAHRTSCLKGIMQELKLNTVCEDAHCPNIGECWHRHRTFAILGDVCTRLRLLRGGARPPNELDTAEPAGCRPWRMGLKFAVITSVDRDDLGRQRLDLRRHDPAHPRARPRLPHRSADPGLPGRRGVAAHRARRRPDVLNHNVETVRVSIGWPARAALRATLELLDRSRTYRPDIATKTGLMGGLGEERDEILSVFDDLRRVGVSILTIGQYLRPSATHAPMKRYYHPDEFGDLKQEALARGFVHVESGPLVRSSYHAHEQADAFDRSRG
jgi:lipoic acid synthetase